MLGESEDRILQELKSAGDKGLSNKDLLKIPGMFPSNLSKFLKRLQDPSQAVIERDVKSRRYRILDAGQDALNRKDDMLIISRSKRSFSRELEPSDEIVAPRVLPVQASIYLNEQILAQSRMISRQEGISEADVQKQILAELAESTAYAFEQMLRDKFYRLVQEWHTYHVQQMPRKKRREYLGKVHPDWPLPLGGSTLDHVEAEYMKEKFPEGGPDMALKDFLDFEAALVVKVSRARIIEDLGEVKDRLVMRILADIGDDNLYMDLNQVLPVMFSLGLITRNELRECLRGGGKRGRERVVHKLWDTYYERAWHKKYVKTPVVSVVG